ncbi:hypothetical protein Hanom_Chr10g00924551 [Helianthus anomalus]
MDSDNEIWYPKISNIRIFGYPVLKTLPPTPTPTPIIFLEHYILIDLIVKDVDAHLECYSGTIL